MMKYIYSHHINELNWFIHADNDMYLRADKLKDLLSQMNPYEQVYRSAWVELVPDVRRI